MTGPVFVDANVLLYARDERDPRKHERARGWLDHLWREGRGRTSLQVLSEVYVNLKRRELTTLTPAAAWESVAKYLAWKPRAIDEELFSSAWEIEQRYRISWWDSMVVAAAKLQQCAVLLTEDLHDGAAFGTLVVRSPFTLAVEQPAAHYETRFAALHRPRGRPRRTALA
jgi:predicted nucleic acid-binding protein